MVAKTKDIVGAARQPEKFSGPAKPGLRIGQRDSVLQLLLFLLGAVLPIVTLERNFVGTNAALADRIVPADVVALLTATWCGITRGWKIPLSVMAYLSALVLAFLVAILQSNGDSNLTSALTSLAVLVFAVSFTVIGASIANDEAGLSALTKGILAGLAGETIIAGHDYMFQSSPWFVDSMEHRVRGTFMKSGQLASYAFSMCVYLGTAFNVMKPRRFLNVSLAIAAGCCGIIMISTTRRSALLAIATIPIIFFICGFRFAGHRFYRRLFYFTAAATILIAVNMSQITDSFLGARVQQAVDRMDSDNNWLLSELENLLASFSEWFPFGIGLGQGSRFSVTGEHEIHNGHYAMLIEGGVVLYAGVLYLILAPAARVASLLTARRSDVRLALLVAVFLASLLFMGHNRIYRDRTFMLAVGVGTVGAARLRRELMSRPSDLLTGRQPKPVANSPSQRRAA